MDFTGKLALITGAANGIGVSYTRELLKAGAAKVAILDVSVAAGEETVAKLGAEFGKDRLKFVKCDVTNKEEFEAAVNTVVADFKTLDIFINNAGIMNDGLWEKQILINVNAVVIGTLLAVKIMSKENGGKGGTVVNIASILGLAPMAGCPVYVGTKHAVIGITTSWALPYHYNKTGVRMLVMCPGVTNTDLISGSGTRQLTEDISSECFRELSSLPAQSTDNVAQGMMHLLKTGANGSVWVSEGGNPVYEVQIPERSAMKK